MIDETIQTNDNSAGVEVEQNTRTTNETVQAEDCISTADVDRYSRMKWSILALLCLLPFLLWLSSLVVSAEGEEVVEVVPTTASPTEAGVPETETGTETGTQTDTSTGNSNYNLQHENTVVNVYLDDLLLPLSATPTPMPESPITNTRIVTETVTEIVVTVQPITQTVTTTQFIEITRVVVIPPPPPDPSGEGQGCTRFNLEVGRNKETGTPVAGTYIMEELSGHRVATWTAEIGWLDSGELRNLPITKNEVHVRVFFYPANGSGSIELEILNPAPNLPFGWISKVGCHAVEIQFPE